MTARRLASLVVIVILIAAAWVMLRSRDTPASIPSASVPAPPGVPPPGAAVPRADERKMSSGCDPLPAAPPLPVALDVKSPTVEGVVQALDASLGESHKAFLRCFPDEDDLVARVHAGFGRWLRNTLRLRSDAPLTASFRAMGVSTAEDMSTVIVRAYGRALAQAPLDVAGAVARTKAMADRENQP